jgi:phosphatidylglycerol:prolipoprotein diacylglycerol transferase
MIPIRVSIGIFQLSNYEGLYFSIAVLGAAIFLVHQAKNRDIPIIPLFETTLVSLISAWLSGRLLSLIFWSPGTFFSNPLIFFRFWEGGISVAGAAAGGIIAGALYLRWKRQPFFYYSTIFIPSLLTGQVIGRFGCLLNGDASGIPSTLPWSVRFPLYSMAYNNPDIMPGATLHPTQVYEMLANVTLLMLLLLTGNSKWITERRVAWYAIGYGTIRFFLEYLRNDTAPFQLLPVLTGGQVISLAGIAAGIILLGWTLVRPFKTGPRGEKVVAD